MKKAIRSRRSVRTYLTKEISTRDMEKISAYLSDDNNLKGPFGNTIRIFTVKTQGELKGGKIGTYGIIKDAPMYIISICKNTRDAILDAGYVFEKLVLFLETMDIGTCWLGGTFSRKNLNLDAELTEKDVIPAISPFGYKHDKEAFTGKLIAKVAKSHTRKNFNDLFFVDDFDTSVKDIDIKNKLEYVRIGPSASNKQPWRILLRDGLYHFYLERTPKYVGAKFGYDMQLLDIGIALAHFEIANEKKLRLVDSPPNIDMPNEYYEYIVSIL